MPPGRARVQGAGGVIRRTAPAPTALTMMRANVLLPPTTIGPARRGSEAVGAERAAALVAAGALVLDLRTVRAWEQDGHLPGAHRLRHELDGDQVASVAARRPTHGPRRLATSHASAARSVAPVPRTQRRPASARAGAPGVSSKSTPGARKR